MRIDHLAIDKWITKNSRVLDLGCGDGSLLKHLTDSKHVHGYGLEISAEYIQACVEKGVNVIEQDLDKGLENFKSDSFDTVIMSYTLQTMHYPDKVLRDMLRIGKEGIVTFPNFGHWNARLHLLFRGRMPVSKRLPYQWYNTPNIHFCTFRDFEKLCNEMKFNIVDHLVVSENTPSQILHKWKPNLFGETGIYRITRS